MNQSAFNLRTCAHEKKVFKEFEKDFENFDKHDVIKSSIAHILRILLICQNGVEQL
jgi:hypothetical protein